MGIVQVGLILGGNFLWWKFPGWELSGGNHSGGSFHVTNKTDNRTDSSKPHTGRILVQMK